MSVAVSAGVTGSVSFLNNGVSIGTATIANGVATLITTALPAGSNSVTASYNRQRPLPAPPLPPPSP